MIVEKSEIFPTMKIDAQKENELDLPFSKINAVVRGIKTQQTKYGEKLILNLSSEKDENFKFSVFMNDKSKNNLIDFCGANTDDWTGKHVSLTKETNDRYGKDMIIATPIKQ